MRSPDDPGYGYDRTGKPVRLSRRGTAEQAEWNLSNRRNGYDCEHFDVILHNGIAVDMVKTYYFGWIIE